ncbi:MAG: serine/threonine protein phosphatase, partial [Pseudomonadota bacterium]
LKLPDGRSMTAKDGMVRQFFRTKFWADSPRRYSDVIFQPDPLPDDIHHALLSDEEKQQLLFYGPQEKPLFIGHYWMWGIPAPIVPNIACLDYSAVKYGRLVAYRMDSERHLQPGKFTWVRVEKSER